MSENNPSGNPPVRLVGGPEDWHGETMDINTQAELDASRESLGAYLISNSVPASNPDPAARAVYEPDERPWPANLWFFRGWVPFGPGDPECRVPAAEHELEVRTDEDGLPTALRHQGEDIRIVRVLAHWQASGENHLAPEGVWHVLTRDGDWSLSCHHGGHWTGGPLPAVEQHSVAHEEWD